MNGFGMLNVRSESLCLASVCPVFKPCMNDGILLVRKSTLQCTDPDTLFLPSCAVMAELCGCREMSAALWGKMMGTHGAMKQAELHDLQNTLEPNGS